MENFQTFLKTCKINVFLNRKHILNSVSMFSVHRQLLAGLLTRRSPATPRLQGPGALAGGHHLQEAAHVHTGDIRV